MICGTKVWIEGQHRFCTVPDVHPNHDMPGPDGKSMPHVSGQWEWVTVYPFIGPEHDMRADYDDEDDE